MATEVVELRGHIVDSRILPRAIDLIVEAGADYAIEAFEIGRTHADPSYARIAVSGEPEALDRVLRALGDLGATTPEARDASLVPAEGDGVFPDGFYSTTSWPTAVRIGGTWVEVERPEMDCGIVVEGERARTVPMADVRAGEAVVVGHHGVRVTPITRAREGALFRFMGSEASSEKPQGLLVERVAALARGVRDEGGAILWVLGPAVVHTGSIEPMCALIRSGWVQIVFAGNALVAHDAEAAMFGTSLGVSLAEGTPAEHGNEHHLRAINAVRRAGSLAAAVREGLLPRGIIREMVAGGVDYVLAASPRDDGPMPEVLTDMLEVQRQMRARVPRVGLAIMLATMLHSIATSNVLPGAIPIVCVDINPATVTKLIDRGGLQAVGVVTDVGLFLRELAGALGAR